MSLTDSDEVSSIDDPIHFFFLFFEKNGLESLRKDFMPDPYDELNWMHFLSPSISQIDFDNNRYSLFHRIEVAGHGDDELGIWIVDEYSYEEKTYVFEEFLNETFKSEYLKSRDYLSKALNEVTSPEKGQHLCSLWIDTLLYYIKLSNEEPYKHYIECARPLEAIIRYLLEKYPTYCPSLKGRKDLLAIRDKIWGSEIQSEKQLMPTIFSALVDFNDDEYEHLILREDYSSTTEKGQIVKALNELSQGLSHKIPIINFQWDAAPVYYIFKILMKYNKRLVLTEIEENEKILIKGKPFVAANSYTGANRFENNPGNKIGLKNKIDSLFNEHIK